MASYSVVCGSAQLTQMVHQSHKRQWMPLWYCSSQLWSELNPLCLSRAAASQW